MSASEIAPPPPFVLRDLVVRALFEDLGRGDVTADACVPPGLVGRAALVARQRLVVCGLPIVAMTFAEIDPRVVVALRGRDGAVVEKGTVVAEVSGPAGSILKGERVALNFAQRASGVATKTRAFVDALPPGSKTRITDTRKTTPGLRAIERWAVPVPLIEGNIVALPVLLCPRPSAWPIS